MSWLTRPIKQMALGDKVIHAYFMENFPNATRRVDTALELAFKILTNAAFAVIVTLVLIVLGGIERVSVRNAICIWAAWLVAFIWIARSKQIRDMTVLSRLAVVAICGVVLGVAGIQLEGWAMREYERSSAPPPLPQL